MISNSNQLELKQLRYFLVLAETLHYGRAAEKLHMSQSALSQQIKQLEAHIGSPLFERNNRKVSLNRAGELLHPEAQLIRRQMEQSIRRWQLRCLGAEGEIRIGFVGSAMQQYLPPRLKDFVDNHPLVKLDLEELTNREQLRAFEQGQIDIGFMRSNQVGSKMGVKSVYRENFSLVLPKGHPINSSNFKNMGQLREESFILFPNQSSPMYYQQILNMCVAHGFSPKVSHRSIHGPTIFKLVENGMGISVVPNSLRDEKNYDIRFIELDMTDHKTELFAVWNKESENPCLNRFLEAL